MIATKPSDLHWQRGPLPEPQPNLILLVWIAGPLANHIDKAFASDAHGMPRWAIGYHIPIENVGEVRFYAVLRDEPYRGYVPLAAEDKNDVAALIKKLGVEGGSIVAASECTQDEIIAARGRGDIWSDPKGFKYVRRPPEPVAGPTAVAEGVAL